MKRILAVFLTLAMALNIAPMAAFAAADSDAASIVAVEETDETSSPQLDEETARAIVSDPFLQAAYAQTEQEQTGQAEVDTSNMSVSATNSFGQLLVNGIEGQSTDADGSTNRITNVTMNGRTANVQFVLDGTADLMVAIYTDSTEEELVASGTTEVSGSADNGAAQVSIVGDIPETYTIKAFLLDKTDHSPLSSAYTDVSHTQVMVDLDKATVNDFPEDRVINLDGQANTNFAVVNKETTLLTYEDNTAGENQLLSEDDTSLVYTFGNAGAEIRNLQPGDILTYEYAPGELLIARVQDITVNGDVVTIQGDDTLELEDVFDALKIENDANTQDFDYTPADGFTDCGESVIDASLFEGGSDFTFEDVDATNKKSDEIALPEVSRKCEFYKDIDSDEGKKDDHTTTLKATVSGSLNLSAQGKFKYYIAKKRQSLEFGVTTKGDLKLEISGAAELSVPVGRYDFSPIVGVFIGMEPALVVRAALNMNVDVLIEDYIGFRYNSKQDLEETPDNTDTSATEDPRIVSTSKTPTIKIKGKATGSLFVGIDLQPRVRVMGDWVASVEMSCEFGGQITVTLNEEGADHLAESKHTCGICYSGKLDFHASSDISVKFLKSKIKIGPVKLIDVPIPLGDFYWSPKYAEFGKGECPHIGYRVQMRISTTDEISNEDVDGLTVYNLYSNGKTFPLGAYERSLLEGANIAYIYLEPGPYQLQVTVKGVKYTSDKFAISDGPRDFMYLYAEHTGTGPDTPDPDKPDPDNPNPDPSNPDPTPPSETIVASGTCGDNLTWKLDDEGTLTISGKGAMTEWVDSDSAPWKTYSNTINKVVIQPGVTSIGKEAFSWCKNLRSITIPEGVTSIKNGAFYGCGALTSVTIPESVTSIEDSVFAGCGLRSITIPEGVTSIGEYAFYACENLKSITIPKSVTSIERYAFQRCSSLKSITIPEGVTSIENMAFYECSSLMSITIPEGVTSIGSDAFSGCSSLTSITIPEGVTSIGSDAFSGCSSLTSITIPKGVTSIWSFTFSGCSSLTSITIPEGVTSIGDSAFEACRGLTSISLPESVIKIGNYAFKSTALTGKFVIPSGVTKIGDGLFENCQKLTEVVIPDGITFIGPYAFKYTGITSFVIPDGIRTINVDTFYGTRLDRITIPVSVTAINPSAFGNEYVNGYVKEVHYTGTKSDWSRIWVGGANERLREATIHCTDGDILPTAENSITTGAASASGSKFQATFANAKAGKEYVVLVSRSGSDPLNADNLIYINQITADADGELAVPFITAADAAEMTYVVACAQDDATVDPGQPDQPGGDKPGGDQPSSGGDGGGAAIILIGGVAAVAAVAGVALLMPVKVEGTVKLADQPVANATVQVLKNGNVAAQTTTDANGHFTVKVKRGGYTLRVQWTDASGQPVTRTVDFKAPDANLNVAA